MFYLDNPLVSRRKARRVRRKVKRVKVARRRSRRAKKDASSRRVSMAARRRRRRRRAVAAAPRRRRSVRRRRRAVVVHANPIRRRRRRRRSVVRSRRQYHRNPGTIRGVMGIVKQGAVDGAFVLAGEIVQNKVSALVDRIVPQMGGIAGVVRVALVNGVTASAIGFGASKAVPKQARMLTAGAFARGLANVIATTPAAALLGDGAVYDDMSAYPEYMGAYPREVAAGGMGAYPSPATADLPLAEY